MKTEEKLSIKHGEGELVYTVSNKTEAEWLADDSVASESANQEFPAMELLQSIKTEEDPECYPAQQFTPDSQTTNDGYECIKTELMSDEEFLKEENASDHVSPSFAQENQQSAVVQQAKMNISDIQRVTRNNIHSKKSQPHSERRNKCEFCLRLFKKKSQLKTHLVTHVKNRKREFACNSCDKSFYTKAGLVTHMRLHTGDTFNCALCDARFMDKQHLKVHLLRKHIGDSQQISPAPQRENDSGVLIEKEIMADEEFLDNKRVADAGTYSVEDQQCDPNSSDEKQARVSIVGTARETCKLCHNIYPKDLIKTHMRMVHFERILKCEVCLRCFKKKSHFDRHMSTHAKDRKREFACHVCESAFYTKCHLMRHLRYHTGETFNCQVCEARFTQKGNLKTHLLSKHVGRAQQLTPGPQTAYDACIDTNPELISNGDVASCTQNGEKNRLQTADDQQVTKSETCELSHNILSKESQGNCERPLKCELCLRFFENKTILKTHLVTHANDRKPEFACHFCDKTFYSKRGWVKHLRYHTGETFNCDMCGARFTDQQHLKVHLLRKHMGETQQITPATQKGNDLCVLIKGDLMTDEKNVDSKNTGSNTDSYAHEYFPDAQTADSCILIKSELMLEEEFLDEQDHSNPTSCAHEDQQCGPNTSDGQQERVSIVENARETCKICHNIYPKELIKTHMRLMHLERASKCEVCLRCFKQKSHLNRHMSTHAKDRKREFTCHVCESAYYNKGHLVNHLRIHTGDTYTCQVCGSYFTQKGNLKMHMLHKHGVKTQQFTSDPSQAVNDASIHIKEELISDDAF